MGNRSLQRTFSSGEITPELFGRIDLAKRQEGLATCRNFITLPHGPAVNRPGTEFVAETKGSVAVRLVPFSYNNVQTFAIQVGPGFFRFHTQAGTLYYATPPLWGPAATYVVGDLVRVASGAAYYCIATNTNQSPPNVAFWYPLPADGTYEIPSPYAAADLFDLHYVQSADVLTIVHPNYRPLELRRYGATNWQTTNPSFAPPANPLTGVAVAPTGTGTVSYGYVVTAVQTSGQQETVASAPVSTTNNLATAGNRNTISWTDPSAAGTHVRYYVYKAANGIYGYIGQSATTSFVDDNITADVSRTPPISDATATFDSTGNYPAAVSYWQQRRVFAGTNNQPQNVWMTRSGTESNMSYNLPVQSDNRIALRIAAREASAIRHVVPAGQLLFLTASAEWRCGASGDVLTPSSVNLAPQSYVGASNVQPVIVNNLVLYVAARGGHVRELAYQWQAQSHVSGDISLMAPHLFDYADIVQIAYSRGPIPVLWAVSTSGQLLGLTYVPEQQIAAWHRHDTAASGAFESCCVISEANEDMLYVVVKRTINGATKRYVERLHTRRFDTPADAFFVDCGLTYSGAPITTVSGLSHLEGQTVNILADGAVMPQKVVTGGTVTLDQAASKIHVGLPITAQLQTLPLALASDGGMGQGRQKNVNKIFLRVYRSSGILAGPAFNSLTPFKQRTTEPWGSPPALVSDEIEIVPTVAWGSGGQVCVQQTDPLPLDITSMTVDFAMGA